MEKRAENLVHNIGAIAETTSVFYNSIVKQVPRDVALVLTQHFMDITMKSRQVAVPASAVAAAAAEVHRRVMEQQKEQLQREQEALEEDDKDQSER